MGRHLINTVAALAVAAIQFGIFTPAFAQSDEAIEAARRVNIAGRQRMLSQRMSKAACFVSTGVDAQMQESQLQAAFNLFSTSHDALRYGNAEMGLTQEQNQVLKDALAVVDSDWTTFSPLIETALSNGFVSRPALARINEVGLVLLANMNRAVNKTANTYGESLPDMPLLLSLTIDLAGRQRMFTQKAAKEFCLVDAGIDEEANRANLAKTANLFSLTLQALISGMPGMVMAAPNDEIKTQLEAVAAAWAGPKAVLENIGNGGTITEAQRQIIATDMEQVLILMNQGVGMYESVIPAP